jgi:hypothetical protein
MPPSRRWAIKLALAAAIMIFICGLPCDKSFTNQRGLNNHRNSCQIYQQNHVHAVEQRKERLLIRKQKAKQKAQNAPSVNDTAAASIQSGSASQAPLTDIVTALAVAAEVRFYQSNPALGFYNPCRQQ